MMTPYQRGLRLARRTGAIVRVRLWEGATFWYDVAPDGSVTRGNDLPTKEGE